MSRIADETKAVSLKDRALQTLSPLAARLDRRFALSKLKSPSALVRKTLKAQTEKPFNASLKVPNLPTVPMLSALWPKRTEFASHAVLSPQLHIEIADETKEGTQSQAAMTRGQFLARQDRWDILLKELADAERTCAATPARTPVADLLAFGARGDVVSTAEHALRDGLDPNDAIVLDGVMALERIRIELKRPALMTTVVALTHIDLGWNCRDAASRDTSYGTAYQKRGTAHFERAQTLLKEVPLTSPLALAAQCALFSCIARPINQVTQYYGRLIDLAPKIPRHMRTFGTQLLPQNGGSYAELELQAQRVAERTQSDWAMGGYTWVYFDAIAQDLNACAHVNTQQFLDGLADIVDHGEDQEMINLLVAYCLVTFKDTDQDHGQNMGAQASKDAQAARSEIRESAHWLVRNHLQVLHPVIWGHAAHGFTNNAPVSCYGRLADEGRRHALAALETLFQREITAGHMVEFTPNGPERLARYQ